MFFGYVFICNVGITVVPGGLFRYASGLRWNRTAADGRADIRVVYKLEQNLEFGFLCFMGK